MMIQSQQQQEQLNTECLDITYHFNYDSRWDIDIVKNRKNRKYQKKEASNDLSEQRIRQKVKENRNKVWNMDKKRRERKRKVGRTSKAGQLNEPTECFGWERGQLNKYYDGKLGYRVGVKPRVGAVEAHMSLTDRRKSRADHYICLQHMMQEPNVGWRGNQGWYPRTVLSQMTAEKKSMVFMKKTLESDMQ